MKDDVQIDTAITYDHAVEKAEEHGGTIHDDMTGAVTIPKGT
jgi:hypothetical protein